MKKIIWFTLFFSLILIDSIIGQSEKKTDYGYAEYQIIYQHFREASDSNNIIVMKDTKEVIDYDKILKNYTSTLLFNNVISKYETSRTQSLSRLEDIFGGGWVKFGESYYNCLPRKLKIKEKVSKGGIEYTADNYKIEWTITDEEFIINGIKCIKANGKRLVPGFKTSVFSAWFTPDIPVPFGPEDVNGLPGLIVKFKWANGVVEATSIKSVKNQEIPLKLPKTKRIKDTNDSIEEMTKVREDALKNRQ